VDVLVQFEEGRAPGWEFFGMGRELAEMLGRRVDFLTSSELSTYYRDDVLAEAESLYDAA
jgi:predicted nucleotidyltransferase